MRCVVEAAPAEANVTLPIVSLSAIVPLVMLKPVCPAPTV